MVFSSPFRRLQNKTQVFPLPGSIFVHNRLTHSLEVSSVGRSLANEIALGLSARHGDKECFRYFGDIVAAGCLCHDLGNPPFGHSGEKTIGAFFDENEVLSETLQRRLTPQQWSDLVHFEGNANSFRLLTHQFCGRRQGGFAMTYSTLASIVKYPHTSLNTGSHGKFGFFASEEAIFRKVAAELGMWEKPDGGFVRHPLVYIVEAADDICYQVMDIEDAHKLHVLPTADVIDVFSNFFPEEKRPQIIAKLDRVADPNEKIAFMRSNVIGRLVAATTEEFLNHEEEIMSGTYNGTLIKNMEEQARQGYAICSALAFAKIYKAQTVVDVEIAGNRIITYLLRELLEAVLHPEKTSSKLLLSKVPEQYDVYATDLYGKIQSVLDHVSAMTDIYALDLFRKLNGHSLPAV
jgi:dGTPase